MQLRLFLNRIVIALIFCFLPVVDFAQLYPFKIYTEEEGLPQTTVEVIYQDSKGYLWIGTHGGASRFDGSAFQDFTTKEGLISNRVFDITEDRFGNIWFATNSGVTVYNGSTFISLTESDGLPSKNVLCFLKDKNGIISGTSKGAVKVNFNSDNNPFSDSAKVILTPGFENLSSRHIKKIFEDSREKIWIGTDSGLVYQNNNEWIYLTTERGLGNNDIFSIAEDTDGNIWCGTHTGYSKIILDGNREIISIESKAAMVSGKENPVRAILCDEDGKIYMGIPYLAILQKSDTSRFGYIEEESFLRVNGINANSIYSIFKDREGNFWFGGAEHGISKFQGRMFQSFNTDFGASGDGIRGITKDRNGQIWLATNSYVSKFTEPRSKILLSENELNFIEKINNDIGITARSVWSILTDSRGNVWFGGVGGLYKYDGRKYERFSDRKEFSGEVVMRIYEDKNNVMWFLSFSGIFCYNAEKDSLFIPFDEKSPFYKKRIASFYHHSNHDYWFGHSEGLTCLSNGKFTTYKINNGLPDNYIAIITPDKNENLWLATGKGISKYDGKNFSNFTAKDGLSSDTPYLLLFDNDWNLWIGSNKGLDKIIFNDTGGIDRIRFYGKEEGFIGTETNSNAAYKDESGDLWFGTMKGAVRYRKKYEKENKTEPKTFIDKLRIDFTDQPLVSNLSIPYDKNHITFYYKSICLSNPKKVRYKYKLTGFDKDWSPETNETYTTYSNLPPGDYTFQVLACNNDNVWNPKPVVYQFIIEPPFWRTYWFYFLCLMGTVGSIYFYVKWKTFKLEESQKLLKEKVEERTNELYIQNKKLESAKEEIQKNRDELENKNKDITDSITYARRIQETLLPDIKKIKDSAGEIFIYYRPKDIVSGDFYWYHKNGEQLYLAVADCTGHGVPGAFMSMLGIAFLNEITAKGIALSPAEVLNQLRNKIIKELSQYGREGETKDGMDISLLSIKFDQKNSLKNIEVQWAGANNPLWCVPNKELSPGEMDPHLQEIKPDNQPVGYYLKMEPFTNHCIQMNKGDCIYLFSDGFPDQFGGSKGKKFKYARLKELLLSISANDMDTQKKIIRETFENWKGELEQVDDICIVGLRV